MGQVCQKHNEFYETECRWCPKRFEGADQLSVAPMPLPSFKKVFDLAFAEYLGAEKIGPEESKFWMDFVSQKFCKADIEDLSESPLDRHGGCE